MCFTCPMVWMSAAVAAKKRWQMTRDSAIVCQYDDRITKKLLHTNPILSFHPVSTIHPAVHNKRGEHFWKVYHNRLLVWSQIPIIPLSSGLTFYTFSFHFLQNESVWYFGTRLARIISPKNVFRNIHDSFISFKKMMITGGIFKRHPDRNSGSGTFQK